MVRSRKIAGLVLAAGLAVGGFTASTAGTASASRRRAAAPAP